MIEVSGPTFLLGATALFIFASLVATLILIKIYISSQRKLDADAKVGITPPGIRPSKFEEIFAVIFIISFPITMLGSLIVVQDVHWFLLKKFVYQPGDILVTGYAFGFFPVIFFAMLLLYGCLSLIFDLTIKWWAKKTHQTVEDLTPLSTAQLAESGTNKQQTNKLLKIVTIVSFLLTLPGFFSYTRLSHSGVFLRHWPGIITKEYTLDQITGIWLKKTYSSQNFSSQPTIYYAITFNDGQEWKSTQLWSRRDCTLREVPDIKEAITTFALSAGIEIKQTD